MIVTGGAGGLHEPGAYAQSLAQGVPWHGDTIARFRASQDRREIERRSESCLNPGGQLRKTACGRRHLCRQT